jgi:hypothetical protein
MPAIFADFPREHWGRHSRRFQGLSRAKLAEGRQNTEHRQAARCSRRPFVHRVIVLHSRSNISRVLPPEQLEIRDDVLYPLVLEQRWL